MGSTGDVGSGEGSSSWCSVAVLGTRLKDWIWEGGGSIEGLQLANKVLCYDYLCSP